MTGLGPYKLLLFRSGCQGKKKKRKSVQCLSGLSPRGRKRLTGPYGPKRSSRKGEKRLTNAILEGGRPGRKDRPAASRPAEKGLKKDNLAFDVTKRQR